MNPTIDRPAVEIADALLKAVSYGVIVLDAEQRVLLWSAWLEKTCGTSAQAAQGRTLVDIFPEIADSRVQGAIETALRDGFPSVMSQSLNKSPFPLYGRLSPKEASQRIQQKVTVVPLTVGQAEPRCLIEIFDVSLAVHRQKLIDEQKKFLNTILESEPECVMVLTPEAGVTQINQAGLTLFEVDSLAALSRAGLLQRVLPPHQDAFKAMVQRVFAGENASLECNVQGCRGAKLWIDITATPLRDAKGAVGALLAVARDTTARRQAEATSRALIDAAPETALLLDRDGQLLAINEVAARRLGAKADALLGKNFFALIPPEIATGRRALAHQVFSTGQPGFMQDTRAGLHFDVSVYPVFDSAGGVVSIAVYAADITAKLQQIAVERLFHQIDQQILHGQSKFHLFNFVCSEVARIFSFTFVWIGKKNVGGTLAIAAWGGDRTDYFSEIEAVGLRWDDSPLGQGPSGRAIRTGQTQLARAEEASFSPWRAAAVHHDLHAYYSIPLILGGEVFGCFTVASQHGDTFDNVATVTHLADIASRICVAQERANDHEQLRLLKAGLSATANGVFITDQFGRIQWLNAAFVAMTGYSQEEVLGSTPSLFRSGRPDNSRFEDLLAQIGAGEAWSGETIEQRKDGSRFSVRQTITPMRDASGKASHFISILEDVTAMRAAEAKIAHLAHYDLLTELPNRALFSDHLRQAVALARRSGDRLALMFLDLDHFKHVNDTHGHDVGDVLLQQVAQRLKACVRASDTVARFAGDEFTVVLPAVANATVATLVAEKLNAAFEPRFDVGALQIQSGLSIGIAIFPDHADNDTSLLKCADTAMYAAKRSRSNRFCVYQSDAPGCETV